MNSIFISHGSPMLALEDKPTSESLRGLGNTLGKPGAIIVVSAHWETETPEVTGASELETIHDFYGFPEELYKINYPAKGHTKLVSHVIDILCDAGIRTLVDDKRGLDHGAWDPLYLMYPHADVPVIQLSVQPHKDAPWHYNIGKILSTLRSGNNLIIGSGNLTHNLREAFRGKHETTPQWVSEFTAWVHEKLEKRDVESLLRWETEAPHAKQNHPTPEHFLPFFVALGAGDINKTKRLHDKVDMGVLAMDAYRLAKTFWFYQ